MTVIELARDIATTSGQSNLTDDELEAVIWGRTGFPSFWRTGNPEEEFAEQLRRYFSGKYDCYCRSKLTSGANKVLCDACDSLVPEW